MVEIKIPSIWRSVCDKKAVIQVPHGSLLHVLQAAVELYPALENLLFTSAGEVQPALNLFINQQHVRYLGGLQASVQAGDEIYIVPMISGGSGDMLETIRLPNLRVQQFEIDLHKRSV